MSWVERFVRFHGMQHPSTLGVEAVSQSLAHLAKDAQVAASTQNQALAAILFLYAHVPKQPIEQEAHFGRAKRPVRLPVVLSPSAATMIYTHVVNRGGRGVRSPLDASH